MIEVAGVEYLKKAAGHSAADAREVREAVRGILDEIEREGDAAALRFGRKFDRYDGNIVLTADEVNAAADHVPEQLRNDIRFAWTNIRRFAEAQRQTMGEMSLEVSPGLFAGQKLIPCNTAGCYTPGGRYSHVASAMMTITTAKVAGCKHIVACSPPKPGVGIPAAIVYTANLCGADTILALGGVQGIAAMAFGLLGQPAADILVGPGNQYVAEAKRMLFGRVGIDTLAGPTNSLVLADDAADADFVAWDLVGQAEHGYNSPVWLATTHRPLAQRVLELAPRLIASLPEDNRRNAEAAWRDFAEIIVVATRSDLVRVADAFAPEHLHVQARDTGWFLERLRCYGSLFLGEETTVAFGDKAAGPNHVLPTNGAARYTGGLSVHKFMKVVTWQRATRDGVKPLAASTARISRLEGMEAHARTADIRIAKYFPDEAIDLGASKSTQVDS
ncbi:MAG: histidinol dehydrogenase [Rhodobacteraceae bacterium]|nr:histidinol dehydrogenase [Paracoccaceae bacterium]